MLRHGAQFRQFQAVGAVEFYVPNAIISGPEILWPIKMRCILSVQSIAKLLVLALLPIVAGTAGAASVAKEEDILARLQQTLENNQAALEDIENDLLGSRNKLADAQADLVAEQQQLTDADKALTAAQQAYDADPSQENRRALKKAEHSKNMAERGVRNRNNRFDRISRNVGELEAQLATGKSTVASTKRRVARQQERLDEVIAAAAQQSAEPPAAAPVKPVVAAAPPPPVAKPAVAAPLALQQSATDTEIETDVAPAAAAAEEAAQLSELDREALDYAAREMGRLEKLLAAGNPGKPSFRRLYLRGSKVDTTQFDFLGRNQYRAEVAVAEGKQLFEIGRHKFRRTVPASDDGEVYVFIFDAKRLSRPRLAIFKKSLLEQI